MSSCDIIVFDTETTGLPVWKEPSGGEQQPHIVQLAASLVDPIEKRVIDSVDFIVRPDGWEIPADMTEIHGISNERAMDEGIPEADGLDIFLDFWASRHRVAFNTTFDNRIIRIATKRFCTDAVVGDWKTGSYECAMIGSRKVMGGRNPKLSAAYKYFTGKEIEGAHNAVADVAATIEVYYGMKSAQ